MKIPPLFIGILILLPLACCGAGDDDFRKPPEFDTPNMKQRYPSVSPSDLPSLSPSYAPTVDPCSIDLQGNNRKADGNNFVAVEYNYELTLNKTDAKESNFDSFIKEMELNITTFVLEELYPICKKNGVKVGNHRSLRAQNSFYRRLSEHGGRLEGIRTLPNDEVIKGRNCQYEKPDVECKPVSGSLTLFFKDTTSKKIKEAGSDAVKNIVGTLLCNEGDLFVTSNGLAGTVVCQENGPGIRLSGSFNKSLFISCLVIAPVFALILASLCYVRKQKTLWGYKSNDEVSPLSPTTVPYISESDEGDIDPELGIEKSESDRLESKQSGPSQSQQVPSRSLVDPEKTGQEKVGGFFSWLRRGKKQNDDLIFEEKVKHEIAAEIRLFSGCGDSEQAADVQDISDFQLPMTDGEGGACTAAFLKTLYAKHAAPSFDASYVDILKTMRQHLEAKEFTQMPQLSSTRVIKVANKFQIVNPNEEELRGTRRALLIGIRYTGQAGELDGCHNDVENVKEYLVNVQGFENRNIAVLMDDGLNTYPTKDNILAAYRNLVKWSKAGDSIFCHFSGHGVSTKDKDGDEPDGQDENLVPVDYATAGLVVDDYLYANFVKKMPRDVLVTCLFDCCHSGTALDLPYEFSALCDQSRGMSRKSSFKFREIPTEQEDENEKRNQRYMAISNNIGIEDDMVAIPEEASDDESENDSDVDPLLSKHNTRDDDKREREKSVTESINEKSESNVDSFHKTSVLVVEEGQMKGANIPDVEETDDSGSESNEVSEEFVAEVDEPGDDTPADTSSFDYDGGSLQTSESINEMTDQPEEDSPSIDAGLVTEDKPIANVPDVEETDDSGSESNEVSEEFVAEVDEPGDDTPADTSSFDYDGGSLQTFEDKSEVQELTVGMRSLIVEAGATSEVEENTENDTVVSGLTSMGEIHSTVKGQHIDSPSNEPGEERIGTEDNPDSTEQLMVEKVADDVEDEEIIPPNVGTASVASYDQSESSPKVVIQEKDASESTAAINFSSGTSRDVVIEEDIASDLTPTRNLLLAHSSDSFTEAPVEDPPLVDGDDDDLIGSSPHVTDDSVTAEGVDVVTDKDGVGTGTPVLKIPQPDVVLDETIDEANNLSYLRHSGNAATQAEQTAREMETAVKEILSHASSEDRLDDELSGGSSKKQLSFDQYVITTGSSIDDAPVLEGAPIKELLSQASTSPPSAVLRAPTQPSVESDGEASPVESSLGGILSDGAIAIGDSHQRPPLGPGIRDVVIPGTIDFVSRQQSHPENITSVGEGQTLELSERYLQKMKEYKLKKAKRKSKYQTSPTLEEEKEFVDDQTTLSAKELLRLEAELEFIRLTEEMNQENQVEQERILEIEQQRKTSRDKERVMSNLLAEAEYKLLAAKQEERRLAIEEKKKIAREKKKRVISFLAEVKERTRLVEEAAFDLFNDDGSLASSSTAASLAMIKEKIRNRKRPSED